VGSGGAASGATGSASSCKTGSLTGSSARSGTPGASASAVASPKPRRVLFDLRRIMRSNYRIDAYQETYFVIDSFQQLFDATEPDFTPLYRELAALSDLPADATLAEDRLVS